MTGPNNPLRLRASRLDGGAPPPLPFVPDSLRELVLVLSLKTGDLLLEFVDFRLVAATSDGWPMAQKLAVVNLSKDL